MKRRKKKHKSFVIIIIVLICIIAFGSIVGRDYYLKEQKIKEEKKKIEQINNSYNKYVITNKESKIYDKEMNEIGHIGSGVELTLDSIKDEYYLITNLDDQYYIKYTDIDKIDNLSNINTERYKKYIPFNENIKTTDKTELYDKDNNLVVSLNKEYSLPIIVKDNNRYGVEYNDQLLYVNKDSGKVIDNHNTDNTNIKGIPVLNYHFVYMDGDTSCKEVICHSETFFRKHMNYIKENNYFTPTMNELEMYIDGKIRLPKSVVITFDDGRYLDNARKLLEEYKLNGTFFVISGWNWPVNLEEFKSDYLELHSHTHNMHDLGDCPTGQGGAIQCWSEEKIQKDLRLSREKLNNTTYLAYPFYEYNNYSIEQLKKAGFTMAFGGEYENGQKYVKPGIDKFKLPRWVMVTYTTMNDFTSYLTLK